MPFQNQTPAPSRFTGSVNTSSSGGVYAGASSSSTKRSRLFRSSQRHPQSQVQSPFPKTPFSGRPTQFSQFRHQDDDDDDDIEVADVDGFDPNSPDPLRSKNGSVHHARRTGVNDTRQPLFSRNQQAHPSQRVDLSTAYDKHIDDHDDDDDDLLLRDVDDRNEYDNEYGDRNENYNQTSFRLGSTQAPSSTTTKRRKLLHLSDRQTTSEPIDILSSSPPVPVTAPTRTLPTVISEDENEDKFGREDDDILPQQQQQQQQGSHTQNRHLHPRFDNENDDESSSSPNSNNEIKTPRTRSRFRHVSSITKTKTLNPARVDLLRDLEGGDFSASASASASLSSLPSPTNFQYRSRLASTLSRGPQPVLDGVLPEAFSPSKGRRGGKGTGGSGGGAKEYIPNGMAAMVRTWILDLAATASEDPGFGFGFGFHHQPQHQRRRHDQVESERGDEEVAVSEKEKEESVEIYISSLTVDPSSRFALVKDPNGANWMLMNQQTLRGPQAPVATRLSNLHEDNTVVVVRGVGGGGGGGVGGGGRGTSWELDLPSPFVDGKNHNDNKDRNEVEVEAENGTSRQDERVRYTVVTLWDVKS